MRYFVLAVFFCLLVQAGERARAEYTVIEVNFIMADKNRDLLISKPEYLLVALDTFNALDQNGNNQLDAEELGDLSEDAEFSDNDDDNNGALSVEEVIAEKLADFDAADINKDGALNVDEVTKFDTK